MRFEPVIQRCIHPCLPAITGGTKGLDHVIRQTDGRGYFCWRFLWATCTHAKGLLQIERQDLGGWLERAQVSSRQLADFAFVVNERDALFGC